MNDRFTLTYRNGCALLWTPDRQIPPLAMQTISTLFGLNAAADARLAEITGSVLVTGSQDGLEELRKAPDIIEAAEEAAAPALAGLKLAITDDLRHWILFGRRHPFTDAMCRALTGADIAGDTGAAHPVKTAHLLACRRLLDTMPALRDRFADLAELSASWRVIVAHWDRLCDAADADYPEWRNPPRKRRPGRPPAPGTSCQDLLDRILADPEAVIEAEGALVAAE